MLYNRLLMSNAKIMTFETILGTTETGGIIKTTEYGLHELQEWHHLKKLSHMKEELTISLTLQIGGMSNE